MLTQQESKLIDILSYKQGVIKGYLQDLDSHPEDTEPIPEFDGFMSAIRRLCQLPVQRGIVEEYNRQIYAQDLTKLLKEKVAAWAELEEFPDVDAAYFEQLADNELFLVDVVNGFSQTLNRDETYLARFKEIAGAVLKEAALEQLQYTPVIDEKYRQICEALGWQVHETLNWFGLCKKSPNGENINIVMLNNKNAVKRVRYEADSFNLEEHVERKIVDRYENNNHNVPSLNVLLEDAKAISAMLEELACAFENA